MSLKNTYFILCRPQLGENIGFAARALKNFDLFYLFAGAFSLYNL